MEVLNLNYEPVLWIPIWCLSEPVLSGSGTNYGINVNMSGNRFFLNSRYIILSREEDEDGTIEQICLSKAFEYSEPGIIMIVHNNHLAVVAEEFRGFVHPCVWNGVMLKRSDLQDSDEYYLLSSEGKKVDGGRITPIPVAAGGPLVYAPQGHTTWTEEQVALLSQG